MIVGAGGFFLGAVFARPIGTGNVERMNAIMEEAKRRVLPPVLPPKPAGHTVTENKTVSIAMPRGGFGDFGTFDRQIIVPTTKLVGATPEETAKRQAGTDRLEKEYEKNLAGEARSIANAMFVNDWRSAVVLFKTYSTEVILPFLAALAGVVGAVVTLIKAFRTKPET